MGTSDAIDPRDATGAERPGRPGQVPVRPAPRPFPPASPDPRPTGAEGSRFRRPERPASPAMPGPGTHATHGPHGPDVTNGADGAGGPEGSDEAPLLPADGVDGPPGAPYPYGEEPSPTALAAPQMRVLAEPLAALAAAFQANAEALRRSQEVTADLGRALQRADRSELMLQSTGALNDTFKGVTAVQRTLLQRVEQSSRDAREGRWFLPLIVLAAVALFGIVAYLLIEKQNDLDDRMLGVADAASTLEEARQKGRDEAARDAEAKVGALQTETDRRIHDLEDRLKQMEAERDAEKAARQAVEGDLTAARAELGTTRVDVLKVRALEDEANRLRAEQSLKDPEIERLKRELAEEKRVSADLRKRVADAGLGRPVPAGPEGTSAPPAEDPADDGSISRDRAQIERARARLNELLQTGAANRADYLQVNRIGAIGPTRLLDVQATRHGPTGKPLNSIRAKELRVAIDRARRLVEFTFTEGALDFGGSTIPFPNGVFHSVVADGDAVALWNASGLSVVTTK